MGERAFIFLQKYKLQLVLTGFCFGVALHSFYPLQSIGIKITFTISLALLLFWIALFRIPVIRSILYLFIAILLGIWRFDVSIPLDLTESSKTDFSGSVIDVVSSNYNYRVRVKLYDSDTLRSNPIATIFTSRAPPIGAQITFTCNPKPAAVADQSQYNAARYFHYSEFSCSVSRYTISSNPNFFDVRQQLYDWRIFITRRIQAVLPGDYGMLAAGILYGERGLSDQAAETFRKAGLTHIIAVSGSNITILVSVVFAVLLGLGMRRVQAFWITSLSILLFVGFVGFSASVARAAIMGWLVLLARHLGRATNIWHLLLVVVAILCLIDPWLLAFDAGFALSFLATLGLVAWSPIFSKRLQFIPEIFGLREIEPIIRPISSSVRLLPSSRPK